MDDDGGSKARWTTLASRSGPSNFLKSRHICHSPLSITCKFVKSVLFYAKQYYWYFYLPQSIWLTVNTAGTSIIVLQVKQISRKILSDVEYS